MNRWLRYAGPAFTLLVFATAIYLLRGELERYHWRDIRASLLAIPAWRLAAAAGFTALTYLVLTGYDWTSAKWLGLSLSLHRIALAAFIGHSVSGNLGAVLGGTPVRYRLYSAWGLSAVEVFKMIVLSTVTFWIGFLALAGCVFLFRPVILPDELHLPLVSLRPLGVLLLGLMLLYLVLCALGVVLRWRDWEFALPPLWLAVVQIGIASADLLVSAAVLYELIPSSVGVTYGQVLGVYLLAVVAVLFTHVPGGVGVLELVVLKGLAPDKPEVLGALLAFRFVYYLLPLALALVMLGLHELRLRKAAVGRITSAAERWAPAITPRLLSLAMVLAGAALLFSGAVPAEHSRLSWLNSMLPLGVIEASHLLSSVCGVVLLLLARGLQLRLDSAYWLTVGVLVAAIFLSLSKGFDIEQAFGLIVVLGVLVPCHRFFYRHAALLHEPFTPDWIAAIAAIIIGAVWLATFRYKHVEYADVQWWKFALDADAPRSLRAGVAVAATVIVVSLAHLLRFVFPQPHPPTSEELADARKIVARSPRASAALALMGDKWFLFNDARTAFVMYRVEGRSWIALGDPVGPPEQCSEMAWRFREISEHFGGWTVFYQVEQDHLPVYLDMGLMPVKLGEEARVPLDEFTLEGSARRDLRHARSRLERHGCKLEIVPPEQVPPLLDELRAISDAWLESKHGREKGFSLGYFDEQYLRNFSMAVVRVEDRIVAFANLWQSAGREELSIDLMRYRPDAPSGVMDFLFVELMLWGKAEGFRWFNLGMAPLAGLGEHSLAPRLHRLGGLVFRHGEHFYNFQGLREYKDKFDPVWTPKYLASPGGLALARILAHLNALISRSGD